ncbi:hypothetical protein [Pedobacter sp. SYSU D00535]|uniref:hypothetical protein n=1 Tax=Pedobacter sp. SYSU D00535 TaxID=2810308 RepID=UPI001A956AC3|nr:hypothetical protein [Pedobacter sp. SYSU D00535]
MAELHVQRKPRSSWWLWLIIILVIAALVYFLYTNYYQTGTNPISSLLHLTPVDSEAKAELIL